MVAAVEYKSESGKEVLYILIFLASFFIIVAYFLKKAGESILPKIDTSGLTNFLSGKPPGYVKGRTIPLPSLKKGQTNQQYVDSLPGILTGKGDQGPAGGFFTASQEKRWIANGGDPAGDMQFALYSKGNATIDASILPYKPQTPEAAQANVDFIAQNLKAAGGGSVLVSNFYDPYEPTR